MEATRRPSRARRAVLVVSALVAAALALGAWAYSSPVGSSPDDDFHLASIWCAAGESDQCEAVARADERAVSMGLIGTPGCFAFNPEASGACTLEWTQRGDLSVTDRGNFAGTYPPLFYAAMSVFAGEDIQLSVIVMRLVSAGVFLALLAAAFALLPVRRRPMLLWGAAATIVPLGMFVIPSTNPSSWALASAAVTWIALLGWFETRGRRRFGLGALAILAVLIGAGARADAGLFAAIGVGVVVILKAERSRAFWRASLLPLAMIVIAGAFWFTSGQSEAASGGLGSGDGLSLADSIVLALSNTALVPGLWAGAIWGPLGWLDTAMPVAVVFLTVLVLGGLVFAGVAKRDLRKRLAVLLVVLALWFIPVYLLVRSEAYVGAQVQPRYILPLLMMLAALLLLDRDGHLAIGRLPLWVAAIALSAANAVALHTNMRRYTTGTDGTSIDLGKDLEWWWQGMPGPMAIWAIGSLAFLVALALTTLPAIYRSSGASSTVLDTAEHDSSAETTSGSDVSTVTSPPQASAASQT